MAAIDYIAEIGRDDGHPVGRRAALKQAYVAIRDYERTLLDRLLDGLSNVNDVKCWGILDPEKRQHRLPTVAITHDRFTSKHLAQKLADDAIFAWHGNYYALPLTERLGVEPEGMLRIGLVHYNTEEEIDRLLKVLQKL